MLKISVAFRWSVNTVGTAWDIASILGFTIQTSLVGSVAMKAVFDQLFADDFCCVINKKRQKTMPTTISLSRCSFNPCVSLLSRSSLNSKVALPELRQSNSPAHCLINKSYWLVRLIDWVIKPATLYNFKTRVFSVEHNRVHSSAN